ncbi:4-(cytidine 5'-diphospho)-2-C-methyl-D-erythritol kinase [Devosia sp.]|uniref:4-(cytidine 5'-diphospho)-2-C-methyl-D-erythritol kinase n=1 Tax=Devosia sp. TaxID=1871048 RepID=UPI001AC57876|nr:4-(cytidine 5'-diphospho)-2-C-methyl-D-erythritol kinase [Devosia sp.]MBN9310219.1 4-(cytidine 5'-diphospho)-2-C-methyl-D-erythritol kinase [Devosia sp.]
MAAPTEAALTEAAPAKVNLALHVVGRRVDGYHELESLVAFVDIADELVARPARTDRLTVIGPFAAAAGNSDSNLVMRAVRAFRARWPDRLPTGLDITLTKNLPVAAGIGGGSADAAAMLRLLARLGDGDFPLAELRAIALTLGADVPMCLLSRPAEVRGVGEIIHPLRDFPPTHLVLVNPLVPVATAEVFRRLARRDNPPMPALPQPLTRPAQLGLWLAETRNDLEPAAVALVPAIGELLADMRLLDGCALARMSGSGGTVFGLFGSAAQAHQAAHELRARHHQYWVAAAPAIG